MPGFAPTAVKAGVKPPRLDRAPKKPLKKFNWIKVPDRELNQNPQSLWYKMQGSSPSIKVNFDHLEEQFASKPAETKSDSEDKKKTAKVCHKVNYPF